MGNTVPAGDRCTATRRRPATIWRDDVNDTRRDGRTNPTDRPAEPDATFDVLPAAHGNLPLAPRHAEPERERVLGPESDANQEGEPRAERVDQPEPPVMRTAVLGRLEGLGLIVVVRDRDGKVLAADGTWRSADDSLPLDELRRSFPEGSVTTFAGGVVESPGDRPASDVNIEVVVTGHGDYEQMDGQSLRLVRFSPRQVG
jgi:hypothetical protein